MKKDANQSLNVLKKKRLNLIYLKLHGADESFIFSTHEEYMTLILKMYQK